MRIVYPFPYLCLERRGGEKSKPILGPKNITIWQFAAKSFFQILLQGMGGNQRATDTLPPPQSDPTPHPLQIPYANCSSIQVAYWEKKVL